MNLGEAVIGWHSRLPITIKVVGSALAGESPCQLPSRCGDRGLRSHWSHWAWFPSLNLVANIASTNIE